MSDYMFNVLMDTLRGTGITAIITTVIGVVVCFVNAGNAADKNKPLLSTFCLFLGLVGVVMIGSLWAFLASTWGVNSNL